MRSISSALTISTAHATASFSIISLSSSLSLLLICLESFSSGWLKSSGNITAAANTPPVSGPLPASSHPASSFPASYLDGSAVFNFAIAFVILKLLQINEDYLKRESSVTV